MEKEGDHIVRAFLDSRAVITTIYPRQCHRHVDAWLIDVAGPISPGTMLTHSCQLMHRLPKK